MPRLRDRRVLNKGIIDMPMIWQTDVFALATGYNGAAGRYIGLRSAEDQGRRCPATVHSFWSGRIAGKQRDAEVPVPVDPDQPVLES
jgi:hypothetical protein